MKSLFESIRTGFFLYLISKKCLDINFRFDAYEINETMGRVEGPE
jgi:hypothetical protein